MLTLFTHKKSLLRCRRDQKGSRDCAIDFKQHLFFFDSISSTESDIIHKEVFSIDHSFRNETGSIDSECIKCICDFIFEIVMKHIPFDGGRA